MIIDANNINKILIAVAVYCILSSVIQGIILFVSKLNKKQVGALGIILNMVVALLWRYIMEPTIEPLYYYIGAALIAISLLGSAANFACGLMSAEP